MLIKSIVKKGKQLYDTRSATQKVLGSAMMENAVHTLRRSQQRVVQEDPVIYPVPIEDSDLKSEESSKYVSKLRGS